MAKLAIDETKWYRWNDATKSWDFSHCEKGWNSQQKAPTPTAWWQRKEWKGVKWKKVRFYGGKSFVSTDR